MRKKSIKDRLMATTAYVVVTDGYRQLPCVYGTLTTIYFLFLFNYLLYLHYYSCTIMTVIKVTIILSPTHKVCYTEDLMDPLSHIVCTIISVIATDCVVFSRYLFLTLDWLTNLVVSSTGFRSSGVNKLGRFVVYRHVYVVCSSSCLSRTSFSIHTCLNITGLVDFLTE